MSITAELARLGQAKAEILDAISEKGVEVPTGTGLSDCAGLIGNIEAGVEPIVITSADYLFSGQIPAEAGKFFKIVKPTVMNHMYFGNDEVENVDMTKLDFTPNSAAVNCNNIFYTCIKLKSAKFPAGVKARSLMSVFQGCTILESFDMNGIDVSDCSDYRSFINGCKLLTEFDGSIFPGLSVANNNCQNFFYSTLTMRKVWIPKEWQVAPTTAGYSPFISCGGSNKMNAGLTIYTDAESEAAQIAAGKWSKFTMVYNSSGAAIPEAQIHYGVTHDEYLQA